MANAKVAPANAFHLGKSNRSAGGRRLGYPPPRYAIEARRFSPVRRARRLRVRAGPGRDEGEEEVEGDFDAHADPDASAVSEGGGYVRGIRTRTFPDPGRGRRDRSGLPDRRGDFPRDETGPRDEGPRLLRGGTRRADRPEGDTWAGRQADPGPLTAGPRSPDSPWGAERERQGRAGGPGRGSLPIQVGRPPGGAFPEARRASRNAPRTSSRERIGEKGR